MYNRGTSYVPDAFGFLTQNQAPVSIGPFTDDIHLVRVKVASPCNDLFNNAIDDGGVIGDHDTL